VHGIERDDHAWGDPKLGQKRLSGRDLVGLLSDIDMGEHERGVGRERAEQLRRGAVVKIVEAAPQRLAVECDGAVSRRRVGRLQTRRMLAEHGFDLGGIETFEDVADRGVRGRTLPCQVKNLVQPAAMDVDESDDASIRIPTGDDGEDRKQQDMRQLVHLALPAAGIGHIAQQIQQWGECGHGNLQIGCRPIEPAWALLKLQATLGSAGRYKEPAMFKSTEAGSIGGRHSPMRDPISNQWLISRHQCCKPDSLQIAIQR
jgi:hypothetical protein